MVSRIRYVALTCIGIGLFLYTLSGCDATYTTRVICRGDSVRADHSDTALVRCEVLDSLARR